ncbi:hypothetical protein J2Y02_000932 [Neobacillus drentensis]|nr:hypothetical protein [Neobacillus drentensis]
MDEFSLISQPKVQIYAKSRGNFLLLHQFCFENKRMNVRFFTRQISEKRLYY